MSVRAQAKADNTSKAAVSLVLGKTGNRNRWIKMQSLWSKSLFVFSREDESFNHLGINEIAPKGIELAQPETETVVSKQILQ